MSALIFIHNMIDHNQTMVQEKLNKVLDLHKMWLNGEGGKQANLLGANLKGVSLEEADLSGAYLERANLMGGQT